MTLPEAVRYRFRLRPGQQAKAALIAEWDRCRWVWNMCVETTNTAYENGEECGGARLDKMLTGWRTEHEWLGIGSSVAQQQTVRDFAAARAKCLSDRKNRLPLTRRRGYPRFKSKNHTEPSMNFTLRGFQIRNNRLVLPGKVPIPVVWSRKLPSAPTSVRVSRDYLGHWWASFVVRTQVEPLPLTGRDLGIDWGIREIATTTSDDHDLPHPEFGKKSAADLAAAQRKMARRKPSKGHPGSNGYREAKRQAAKVYAKVQAQRADHARKWAKSLVRDFDRLAVEDFHPKFLARTTMARKAADGAIASAIAAVKTMAAKHGREVAMVNPAFTTMDCAECMARTKHALPLSERIYTCLGCWAVKPRDKNSASVMLVRAGFNPARVEGVRPGPASTGLSGHPEREIPRL